MLIGWLVGCTVPTTVEVPGGLASDPVWPLWPSDVPSLAGCTWTETPTALAPETTWVYDIEGRLTSKQVGPVTTTYTWRRGCLSGLTIDSAQISEGYEYYDSTEVYLYLCDDRDNPISNDHYLMGIDGYLIPLEETRTYVNSYDALEQLATVETWTASTDDLGPKMIDTYTWNVDQQPLVQVHEEPLDGIKVTHTWWWDHELLLGRDEEGTGEDAFMVRTYEDRRLIDEITTSDVSSSVSTTWEYADPPGRFPVFQTVYDGAEVADYEITVTCEEEA